MRPLVMKELREHRWVVLVLWLLNVLGLLVLLRNARHQGSPLFAFLQMTEILGPVSILALANRLVVREYTGRTQLFLETLPVSRLQVIAVKWLTGALLLAIPVAAGFAIVLHVAASRVVLTSRFIALMAVRGGSFLLFAYALAFCIGLTGRYRYLFWGAIVIGAEVTDDFVQIPIQQWPPLHLVSQSMVFERVALPIGDLTITWIVTAILICATFGLALWGEGSLVVKLSQRMSPREKVGVTVSIIALGALLGQMQRRIPKPSFSLHESLESTAGTSSVAIARADGVRDTDSQRLADELSSDLNDIQQYLALDVAPGVFVLPDASIDSDIFLRASLPNSDGVVMRGAVGSEHFEEQDFRAYALEQLMDWYTRERALQEQRRWLLDGFSQWWGARASVGRQQRLTLRAAVAARALGAQSANVDMALHRWLTVREQLGDCLSDALAWRAVSLLAQDLGPDRFQQFMRALLGRRPPDDGRAPLIEASLENEWHRAGAPAQADFGDRLAMLLRDDQIRLAASLQAVVAEPVSFEAVAMGRGALEVHYRLGTSNEVPFAVRYAEIGPWTAQLDRERLARVDATRAGVLPRSFRRGTWLFAAVELRDPQLMCTVRLGARRWELR